MIKLNFLTPSIHNNITTSVNVIGKCDTKQQVIDEHSNKNTSKINNLPIFKVLFKRIIIGYLSFLAIVFIGIKAGYRFNISPSVALGIYQTQNTPIAKNNYLALCVKPSVLTDVALKHHYLSRNLLCPNFAPMMIKKIAGTYGDVVTITSSGVWINGILEPQSMQAHKFEEFKSKQQLTNYQLGENEILLMSDNQKYGFDSRYYGVLKLNDFSKLEIIKPIWTFKGKF